MNSTNPNNQIPKEFANMLSNMMLDGSLEFRKVNDNAELAFIYNANFNGISMDMEFYYDGETVIINYPMIDKYIVVSLEDIINEIAGNTLNIDEDINVDNISKAIAKLIEDANNISTQSMLSTITDDDIELLDAYDYTNKDVVTTSKTIKIEIDSEFLLRYIDTLIIDFKESKDFYNSIKAVMPDDESLTYEDYVSAFDAFDEFDSQSLIPNDDILKFKEVLESLTYTIYLGYDDDYIINHMSVFYGIEMTDEDAEMMTKMDAILNYTFKAHNKIRKVDIPVLTEENSINLFEFTGATGIY